MSSIWTNRRRPPVLLPALTRVRPTVMLSVPLIIEKIYKAKIQPELMKSPVLRKAIAVTAPPQGAPPGRREEAPAHLRWRTAAVLYRRCTAGARCGIIPARSEVPVCDRLRAHGNRAADRGHRPRADTAAFDRPGAARDDDPYPESRSPHGRRRDHGEGPHGDEGVLP